MAAAMPGSKEGFSEHISTDSTPPAYGGQQGRSGRLKRHCVRFWWLYASLVAILVLTIVLPMYVESLCRVF